MNINLSALTPKQREQTRALYRNCRRYGASRHESRLYVRGFVFGLEWAA